MKKTIARGIVESKSRNDIKKKSPSITEVITLNTTSTSSSWTPTAISNSSNVLNWEVTGDSITQSTLTNQPTFNFSGNTGTVEIKVTSGDDLVGLTDFRLPNKNISSIDISKATSLDVLFLYSNQLRGELDVSSQTSLTRLWAQNDNTYSGITAPSTIPLDDINLIDNPISSASLDAFIIARDDSGVTGGTMSLGSDAPITPTSSTAYTNLIAKGWTIDTTPTLSADTESPSTPVLTYANETATTVELTTTGTTDNVGVTSFDIYQDSLFRENVISSELTNYLITGLSASTSYDFNVYAKDAQANISLSSNTETVTTSGSADTEAPTWSGSNLQTPTNVSQTTLTLTWTAASDNIGITGYRIYQDSGFTQTIGNVLTYGVSGLLPDTNYDFNVTALDLQGNESVFSNTENVSTLVVSSGATPQLSNIRVEDANTDRILFNSSNVITASTTSGFTVSDKTITGVTILSGGTTGYFTVSSGFNFFDNNTIRYSGGSDIGIYEFDLQHILNNISEPSANNDIYVDVNAVGANNGTSPTNAYTSFVTGYAAASAGTTVWVKAGTYNENPVMLNSGTVTSPIKIIGYNDTDGIGVKPNFNFDFSTASTPPEFGNVANNQTNLSATAMPIFNGNRAVDNVMWFGVGYTIVKNIQVTQGIINGIRTNSSNDLVFENVIIKNGGRQNWEMYIPNSNLRLRFKDCVSYHGTGATGYGMNENRYGGDYGMYDGFLIVSNGGGGNYMNWMNGSFNIIKGIKMVAATGAQHGGWKGDNYDSAYNLQVDGYHEGLTAPVQARHKEVHHNVYRNIVIRDNEETTGNGMTGLNIWGASDNIFDKIDCGATKVGIAFRQNGNDDGSDTSPKRNIIKNSTFWLDTNISTIDPTIAGTGVYYYRKDTDVNELIEDNQIINCTFYGWRAFEGGTSSGIGNNIFTNVSASHMRTTFGSLPNTYTNCNFYDNLFSAPSGTNITTLNPLFVNVDNFVFNLQDTSPIRNIGATEPLSRYGKDGVERTANYSIGAYENESP